MAIFDVVTTPSRSNPLALLQPRPRLELLFPHRSSTSTQPAHPLPKITYVGLVGNSLYAMGYANFPLVTFDQETAHLAVPEDDVSFSHICDGIRCLVGSRKFEPSLQWYSPPLLDAAPHIPGLPEARTSVDHTTHPKTGNADGDTNDSRSSADDMEARQIYEEARIGKWGIIGFTAMLILALTKFVVGNRRSSVSIQPDILPGPFKTSVDGENPISESIPISISSLSPPDPPSVEVTPSPESQPFKILSTLKPEELTSDLQPPLVVDAGEPEDGDESEREGPSDIPRRKGPRRRKRGKKKKADPMGPEAEQVNNDIAVVKSGVDELSVVPLTPATPIPAPSSLLVSDTVLGVWHFITSSARLMLVDRIWISWHSCV